jgi:hypothetical protein
VTCSFQNAQKYIILTARSHCQNVYGIDTSRVEFHRIAVTDEQIEEFGASTLEIEAFLTPKNMRRFEKLIQDKVDEVGHWDEQVYNDNVDYADDVESRTDEVHS